MEPEFLENYHNDHEDPVDGRTYDFDWSCLHNRLGEAEKELSERGFVALGSALQSSGSKWKKWIINEAAFTKLDADAHVSRRAIALF